MDPKLAYFDPKFLEIVRFQAQTIDFRLHLAFLEHFSIEISQNLGEFKLGVVHIKRNAIFQDF
jgi:hypothetical protein